MRTLFIAALFACCAGVTTRADVPGDDQQAGRQQHPSVMAPQTEGDVGATNASSSVHGRLTCRRYFGCVPATRSAIGFTQD